MKKLTGAFNSNNKKKSTALTNNVKAVETTPRKINEEDYDTIRLYAFKNNLTMLEATNILHKKMEDYFSKNKIENFDLNKDEFQSDNQKSIRITIELYEYLKELNVITKIPSVYIFSYFTQKYLN